MTQVIEAYNYRIGVDARGVVSGAALTKREMSQLRTVFRGLEDPADKITRQIELLTRAFQQGAVDRKSYQDAVNALSAKLPENVQATKALEAAQSKAAAIQRSLMTEEQLYAQELKATMKAVRDGGLAREQAAQHLNNYKAQMPSAIAAERDMNKAQEEVAAITRKQMTDEEKYAAEKARLTALVKDHGLSEAAAKRELDQYRASLKSVSDAEQKRTRDLQRAEQLTEKYQRSTDRLNKELAELNRLERSGQIDSRTANLARRDARRTATAGRLGELAGIPGLGGIAGTASSLVSVAGPVALIAGGVLAAKAALDLAVTSAMRFADAMHSNAQEIQQVYHAASLIQTSVRGLIAFQYAANQTVGLSADQSLTVLTKLSAKIAEAAMGSGEAKPILEQLGLDPKQLAMDDPAKAMQTIFDRVSQIESPLERARIAMKLFEEEGIKLASVMAQGSDGLKAAAERADWLGLTMSDIDAAGISGALDAMTDVGFVLKGIVTQFSTGFYPAATAISQEITLWLQPLTDAKDTGQGIGIALIGLVGTTTDLVMGTAHYANMLREILTLDFEGAATEFEKFQYHWNGGTTQSLADKFIDAQRAAEKSAKEMERTASTQREATMAAEQQVKIEEYLAKLQSELTGEKQGALAPDKETLLLLQQQPGLLQQSLDLRRQIAEANNDREAKSMLDVAEQELKLAQYVARARKDGIDESIAKERYRIRALEAEPDVLRQHMFYRRELLKLQQEEADVAKAEAKAKKDAEQLASDAKSIKESQRKPEEKLAAEFARLKQMRDAELLSEAEFQRARKEAAKNANDQTDRQEATPAAFGVDAYKALAQMQAADRKAQRENERHQQLMKAADELNAKDAKRLADNQAITEQMAAQAVLANRVASSDHVDLKAATDRPGFAFKPDANATDDFWKWVNSQQSPKPDASRINQVNAETFAGSQHNGMSIDQMRQAAQSIVGNRELTQSTDELTARDAERLITQRQITEQLAAQSNLASRMPAANVGGTGSMAAAAGVIDWTPVTTLLDRVAAATEEAANSLRDLEATRSV